MRVLAGTVALAARSAKRWPIARGAPIALALVALTGCNGLQYRYGPPPIIQGSEVAAASANKLVLLRALAQDASIGGDRASDWYLIAEAGFNFIDDQCRAYFDELFFLDRRANRIKTGLFAANQTTQAILAVTGATTPTMNIVAQAFGFGITATDLVAGTYLYQMPPATTQGFVMKLQSAYRRGAAQNRLQIDTPTAAYNAIQRYLDLCLPPRIEAEISKQITGTTARAVVGDGSTVDIETASQSIPGTSDTRVMDTPVLVRERLIRSAGDPLPERKPGKNGADEVPDPKKILLRNVQRALCVVKETGTQGSATNKAIGNFLVAIGMFRDGAQPATFNLDDPVVRPQLSRAIAEVPDCRVLSFANAYEVGAYGLSSTQNSSTDKIKRMQRQLGVLLQPKGLPAISATGVFDTPTRNAISAIRSDKRNFIDAPFDAVLARIIDPALTTTTSPGTTAPGNPTPAPSPAPASPAPGRP